MAILNDREANVCLSLLIYQLIYYIEYHSCLVANIPLMTNGYTLHIFRIITYNGCIRYQAFPYPRTYTIDIFPYNYLTTV